MGDLLDEYWFNGKQFYKLLHEAAQPIPRDQLILELRQRGFRVSVKKGETLSEVENAILVISNQNRINEIAPVVFRRDERVVEFNGSRILNSSNIKPIEPLGEGDPKIGLFYIASLTSFLKILHPSDLSIIFSHGSKDFTSQFSITKKIKGKHVF